VQIKPTERIGAFQLLLVGLSTYVLVAMGAQAIFELSSDTRQILEIVDTGICIVFLIDVAFRFIAAPDKLRFWAWGLVDLLSSIPTLPMLRWGRAIRIIRILRVLRGIRSSKIIFDNLLRQRGKGVFSILLLSCLILIVFSSIAVLHFEKSADSNIRGAGDALWWSLSTVTTVGYGDRFPVSPEGRILGVLLMTAGVGLFATFTGYIASLVVGTNNEIQEELSELNSEMSSLREEIRQLRQHKLEDSTSSHSH
jgi:voltage-gated potassium channel